MELSAKFVLNLILLFYFRYSVHFKRYKTDFCVGSRRGGWGRQPLFSYRNNSDPFRSVGNEAVNKEIEDG